MRVLVAAVVFALVACGADAFSGQGAPNVRLLRRDGARGLNAAAEPVSRRIAIRVAASVSGLAQLLAPQIASAIDFRKMITGEESEFFWLSVPARSQQESKKISSVLITSELTFGILPERYI